MKVGTPNQHGKSGWGMRVAVGGSTLHTIENYYADKNAFNIHYIE